MKTIEYLLWNNCNNNCIFCHMRHKYQSLEEDKMKAIELVKEDINKQEQPFNVLLVGGEIFDNLSDGVKVKLFELYVEIFCNNLINTIYINTNLLYDIDVLLSILQIAQENNRIERIHLTTSADEYGRFNENSRRLFYKNLKDLRAKYPKLNIIVNTILTKQFCSRVVNNNYNIGEYCSEYSVKVNVLPYIDVNGIETLRPTRIEVIKTLLLLKQQDPDWFDGYLDIMTKKDDIKLLQYDYKIKKLVDTTAEKSNCGHSVNFTKTFAGEEKCFACCLEELK